MGPRSATAALKTAIRAAATTAMWAALFGAPALALAQPPPSVGAQVKDPKGAAVGRVERIILGQDGRPRQVLVRVDRVLRALPVEALQPAGDGYVVILTRAEIAALPSAD